MTVKGARSGVVRARSFDALPRIEQRYVLGATPYARPGHGALEALDGRSASIGNVLRQQHHFRVTYATALLKSLLGFEPSRGQMVSTIRQFCAMKP